MQGSAQILTDYKTRAPDLYWKVRKSRPITDILI